MYRVLIATNEDNVLDPLNAVTDWQAINFHPPVMVSSAEEAIRVIETQRVDCVAYMMDKYNVHRLNQYLSSVRPSLPVFQIKRKLEDQQAVLQDVRRILDRLHTDMSDAEYDENTIMDMLRDELTHDLICGDIQSEDVLRGRLQLLRSFVSPDKPCVQYDFDMPQGEVYLSSLWHYGSERLENALRNSFFGRFYEELYYGVAVLTPRHIRVVAAQRVDGETETGEGLLERADAHARQAVEDIKSYLGLDLVLTDARVLPSLASLTREKADKVD